MKLPTPYLSPPPRRRHRYHRPWYIRPIVYIPAAFLVVLVLGLLVYWSILAADLRAAANTFDLSKLEQMESASVILDRNEKIFGQIYVENRETVPYEQLPRDLINAIVAVEDAKFYQHHGYDLFGIVRAALKNLVAGHVRQGASTITQQLARNSFALKEKTFRRKLLEIFLARRIEDSFGKQKIMELYLNRIYFGGGLYGAEAASRGYFSKPAREMTLTECATLAGLVKSPNRLSPWTDKNASRDARNYALSRMRDLGFIDTEKFKESQAAELVFGNRQNAQGQSYAVDYIRQQVIAAVGWDRAMNEGFRIHTTIDSDLQKAAEESLEAQSCSRPSNIRDTITRPTPITRRLSRRASLTDQSTPAGAGIFARGGNRAGQPDRRNSGAGRGARFRTQPVRSRASSETARGNSNEAVCLCRCFRKWEISRNRGGRFAAR